jgi:hypothetical protein
MNPQLGVWMFDHWITATMLLFFLIFMTAAVIEIIFKCVFRTIKVIFRGWPNMPNMDADGDIVLPKKEE